MISPVPGSVKSAMKQAGAVSADLWQVAPANLKTFDGFNVRVKNQAYEEKVRWIADSIKANGFYRDKPLTGFVASESGQDVIYIVGGHRRLAAINLVVSEGIEIQTVPVIIKPRGTSIEDMTVDLAVGNEGEPLTMYEQSSVAKRLVGFGWDETKIAGRLGYSAQHIGNLLVLAEAPYSIRQTVEKGLISASAAVSVLRKHKDRAEAVVAGLTEKGERTTGEEKFKKAIKKHAVAAFFVVEQVVGDPGYESLSKETREALAELISLKELARRKCGPEAKGGGLHSAETVEASSDPQGWAWSGWEHGREFGREFA